MKALRLVGRHLSSALHLISLVDVVELIKNQGIFVELN